MSLDRHKYRRIESLYGHFASWAVWADEGEKPKSNVGDLSIFDLDKNPNLLGILNPNVVMVGLNISRAIQKPFGNFHDNRPQSQDYKLRYAFRNTPFYGAYMTDIIKDFEQLIAGEVSKFLKTNQEFELQNISAFKQELLDVGAQNPLLIAFGNHSFSLLEKHLGKEHRIIKVPHYSMQINKDDYKEKVKNNLAEYGYMESHK